MAHERGICKSSCINDKRSCYHNISCTVVRQFSNGRWLIENQYHYVKALNPESIIFEEGEYQLHHNPNAAPQYPPSKTGVMEVVDEEDFNAKLVRLKKSMTTLTESSVHLNVNGSSNDVDHWSEQEKVWHTKDCKVVSR